MGNNYAPQLMKLTKGHKLQGLVNTIIMPELTVATETGLIADYAYDDLQVVNAVKSAKGQTREIDGEPVVSASYALNSFRLKKFVPQQKINSAEEPIRPREDAMRMIKNAMQLSREYVLGTYMNTSANFTNVVTRTTTACWDSTAADPIGDVQVDLRLAADTAGVDKSNVDVFMSPEVWDVFSTSADVLGAGRQYIKEAMMTQVNAARILGCNAVIVPGAQYKNSAKGQTATKTRIFGKHCWCVARFTPNDLVQPSMPFGVTCHMNGLETWAEAWDEDREGYWMFYGDQYDQYVVSEKSLAMHETVIS